MTNRFEKPSRNDPWTPYKMAGEWYFDDSTGRRRGPLHQRGALRPPGGIRARVLRGGRVMARRSLLRNLVGAATVASASGRLAEGARMIGETDSQLRQRTMKEEL